ncbi:MAG TPA: helical backbone metal receptor [Candidatus Cloacimonadota bacterium]|nr:helical backbone metal receptor [Candidatus Cloacimonadota bacterium]
MRYFFGMVISCLMLFIGACSNSREEQGSIVVLSPETAEIIAALGAADEISGLTRECTYPPELADKTIVGDFGAIDKELVLGLSPKLVFASGLEQEALAMDIEKLGIKVHKSYPKTIADLLQEIVVIGGLIGKEKQAIALRDSLAGAIQEIKLANTGKTRPKVYLEIYRDPLMSVGDDSFVGELIELAGGDNVFDRLERDYSRVKAEQVILANPDIMICYSRDSRASISARKGWDRIPAIAQQRIFTEEDLDPDLIQRAGPRIIAGISKMADIFEQWRTFGK